MLCGPQRESVVCWWFRKGAPPNMINFIIIITHTKPSLKGDLFICSFIGYQFVEILRSNASGWILGHNFSQVRIWKNSHQSMQGPLPEASPTESDQIRPNPTESDQIPTESNRIWLNPTESDQIWLNPTESDQIRPIPTKSDQIRLITTILPKSDYDDFDQIRPIPTKFTRNQNPTNLTVGVASGRGPYAGNRSNICTVLK